jgi:hypothetical protein
MKPDKDELDKDELDELLDLIWWVLKVVLTIIMFIKLYNWL